MSVAEADTSKEASGTSKVETLDNDAQTASARAHKALHGWEKRLEWTRTFMVLIACMGIPAALTPWWRVVYPPMTATVTDGTGRPENITLRGGHRGFLGASSEVGWGELTRAALLAAAVVLVWYLAERMWYLLIPAALVMLTNYAKMAPSAVPPPTVVTHDSPYYPTTEALWGYTAAWTVFWLTLFACIATAAASYLLYRARREARRADGKPVGVLQERIAPFIAGFAAMVGNAVKANDRNTK